MRRERGRDKGEERGEGKTREEGHVLCLVSFIFLFCIFFRFLLEFVT